MTFSYLPIEYGMMQNRGKQDRNTKKCDTSMEVRLKKIELGRFLLNTELTFSEFIEVFIERE